MRDFRRRFYKSRLMLIVDAALLRLCDIMEALLPASLVALLTKGLPKRDDRKAVPPHES